MGGGREKERERGGESERERGREYNSLCITMIMKMKYL